MKNTKFKGEEVLNHFAAKCVAYTFFGMAFISLMNLFNVFGTNKKITQVGFLIVSIFSIISVVVVLIFKLNKPWMKYFLITMIECMTCTICTTLTYHAVIIILFPIVYSCVFMNKPLIIYSYFLSILSIVASVYLGYFFGVCDLNMIFLPTDSIKDVIVNGSVNGSDFVTDGCWWKLLLYFVFPRLIVVTIFVPVCISITTIIKNYESKAKDLEHIATKDGMTGLANKNSYIDSINIYKKCKNIGLINLDANNLKYVNDNYGHENGDILIVSIANAIKSVEKENIRGFRVGGDEFVIVIMNPNNSDITNTISTFKHNLEEINKKYEFKISAAIGYSFGAGDNFDNLIKEADEYMYANKRKFHENGNA